MDDPFALAAVDLFASPVAVDAFHSPAGAPPIFMPDGSLSGETPVRVIRSRASIELGFNDGAAVASTEIVLIPRAIVADPGKGDLLRIGDDRFLIRGKPRLDIEATEWRCELEPVPA